MPAELTVHHPDSSIHTAEAAAQQCIETFIMAVFGENLTVTFTKCLKQGTRHKDDKYHTEVLVEAQFEAWGRPQQLETVVPVCGEVVWSNAETFFLVRVDNDEYFVWGSEWTYDNFKVIAHHVVTPGFTRWYVGDGFEDEVLFRGPYPDLPKWAAAVVRRLTEQAA